MVFKRTNGLLILAAGLVISALGGPAGANSVSYTITDASALRTTDFNISVAFPKFDSTLGTLQDVIVSMNDKGNFSGSLKNNSATAQTFIVGEDIHLNLAMGTTSVLSDDLFVSQNYTALAAKATGGFGTYTPTSSTGLVTLNSGAVFDAFRTATAPVVLDFTTLTKTVTRGGGGNLTTLISTTAGATFTIQYDYLPATLPPPTNPNINGVPEPASLAMTALGGMLAAGFGLARRRSKLAVA